MIELRLWLIRVLAGRMAIALNLRVEGGLIADRPGFCAGCVFYPQ